MRRRTKGAPFLVLLSPSGRTAVAPLSAATP
jgi:hypothetical protein